MAELTAEDIEDFREPVRRLCADRFDRTHVRESGRPAALDRGAWTELCEIGVIGVLAPAERGGIELGAVAAAALWEECGLSLAPGPLAWSALAAILVDGVAEGAMIVTGGHSVPGGMLIEHLDSADRVLLIADDAVRIIDTAGLVRRHLESVDPFTPVALTPVPTDGEWIGGAAEAERLRALGAVLSASYLVGIAYLAVQLARRHALDRTQFGRTIGGFQAVKHLLADMAVAAELAGAAVAHAAIALDAGAEDAPRYVASAKVLAADGASMASKACLQIHGGMGFTWEADPHLLMKRALVWQTAFGDADAHAEAIARGLRLGATS